MQQPATSIPATSAPGRLASLDAYRGLIMFTLLCGGLFQSLKDHPTWGWLQVQGDHVAWEGCVYWDLIQPAFMFIVGVAMPFAFAVRSARGDSWTRQLLHVLVRAASLILLGVILDNFGSQKWSFGLIRVLQQMAFGYVLAFFLLGRGLVVQLLAAVVILVGYALLWMFNPWNGPDGPWAMGGENIGRVFDFWLLGRHYSGNYVGMNAIPEAANMIFGVMAGQAILVGRSRGRTAMLLMLTGLLAIGLGLALEPVVPLIKRIWTPSFAVYSAGWTTLLLGAFHGLIDVLGFKRWAFPLVVVGMNSIAAYVISGVFAGWFRSLSQAWIAGLAEPLGAVGFPIFQRALFALAAWGVLYELYRRRVFFKL